MPRCKNGTRKNKNGDCVKYTKKSPTRKRTTKSKVPLTKDQLLSGEHIVNLEFRQSKNSAKADFTVRKIPVIYDQDDDVLIAGYEAIYFGDGLSKLNSNETSFIICDSSGIDYTEELEDWIHTKKISKKNAHNLNVIRYFITAVS
jgi:hypothetical protein